MPYTCRRVDGRFIVHKKEGDKWVRLKSSGSHGSMVSCQRQVRALYQAESEKIKSEKKDISITGVINNSSLGEEIRAAAKEGSEVRINSPGGDLIDAISVANAIKDLGLPTLVTGQAASAAVLPAISGSPSRMMANTVLVLHSPKVMLKGVYSDEDLEAQKESIEKAKEIYAKMLREKVGTNFLSQQLVSTWLSNDDTYLTAEEALAHGLVDEVIPVNSQERLVAGNFPDRIVAFLSDKESEEEKMSLLDVADKFGIKADDGADNDKIEEGIVAFVSDLQSEIADLKKKVEGKKDPPPKKEPKEFGTKIVAMATKVRQQDLNTVVEKGKISPAVKKKLEKIFCEEDRIVASLQDDAEDDHFDEVIIALLDNESIVSFGGETGPQNDDTSEGGGVLQKIHARRQEKLKK